MKNNNINIDILENGLTLITHSLSWVDSVSIHVAVRAGPRYESGKSEGLAHFLEHMLFEGTKKNPTPKKLAQTIEHVGGQVGAWTDKEFVSYNVKIPKEYLENGISYLSEILFESTLEQALIEKEKSIISEEINRKIDNPESEMWDAFMEHMWGNQPLGKSTVGTKESVLTITQEKLREYLKKFYVPENMAVAVVGNFSKSDVLKLFNIYFKGEGKYIPSEMGLVTLNSPSKKVKIIPADTEQTQVVFGTITGINYFHPDRFIIRAIADILGMGTSSRMFNKLVYELGIAYGTGVFNWTFKDTGIFCMYGGFSSKNVQKAVDIMFNEVEKIGKESVSEEELSLAKIQDIAQTYYSLETPNSLAYYYSSSWATEGRILEPEKIKSELEKITTEDITFAAKKYLSRDNFVGIIRGPMGKSV